MNLPASNAAYMPPALAPVARRSLVRWVITFVLGGLSGVVIGGLIGFARKRIELAWLEDYTATIPSVHAGLVIAFAVLMLWPQVVLHEAGHALGGISRGMHALAFGIGPWRWERSGDRWRLRRAGRVRGISGFAMLLPRGDRGQSRLDQAIYLSGGPLANLVTLIIALALLPLTTDSPVLAALLVGTAFVAAFLGFIIWCRSRRRAGAPMGAICSICSAVPPMPSRRDACARCRP